MAILTDIPPGLDELLHKPPAPGNRNIWLFTVAKRARRSASRKKVTAFLEQVCSRWSDRDFSPEIKRAVERAFEDNPFVQKESAQPAVRAWPEFSPEAWQRHRQTPVTFSDKPLDITTEQVIDALFPGNPLLCAGLDVRSAQTQPREEWRGKEAALQFIVANPMTATTGATQSGHASSRCLANACRRRTYQVVEFDRGSLADQAAILTSLSGSAAIPLVLLVWSGSKSLHGWFFVRKLPPWAQLRFYRHAVFLGADPSLWDPCKLVRMPGGRRDNGAIQHIYHFNPVNLHESPKSS